MRPHVVLAVVVAAVLLAAGVWYASGGRFVLFFLPLLFALPLLGRRRSPRPPLRGPERR